MTIEELKRAVLEKLLVVPAGGPYPNDDAEKVQEKYDGLYAELRSTYTLPWNITQDIPANVQESLVMMLSFRAAADFGVPEPRYSRLRLEGAVGDTPISLAERRFRQIVVPAYASSPARTDYY